MVFSLRTRPLAGGPGPRESRTCGAGWTWTRGVYRQDAAHTDEHDKGVCLIDRTGTSVRVARRAGQPSASSSSVDPARMSRSGQPTLRRLDRDHEVGRCRVRRARLGDTRLHVERVEKGAVGAEERDRQRHHGVPHREARRVGLVVAERHAVESAEIGDLHQPDAPAGRVVGGEPEAQLADLAIRRPSPGRRWCRSPRGTTPGTPPVERATVDPTADGVLGCRRAAAAVTSVGGVVLSAIACDRRRALSRRHTTRRRARGARTRGASRRATLREHSGAPGAAHRAQTCVADIVGRVTCESCGAADEELHPVASDVRHAGRLGHRRFRDDDAGHRAVVLRLLHDVPARPRWFPGPTRALTRELTRRA